MSIMFKYAVKYKGQFYPPNTPIVEAAEDKKAESVNLVTDGENDKNEPKNDKVAAKPKKGKVKKDA